MKNRIRLLNLFVLDNKNFSIILLALTYATLLFTLTSQLMIWVLVLGLCATAVRVAGAITNNHLPSVRTVNLLAVLSIFALVWFGFSIGLLNSMINLLAVACALKLMQVQQKRDFHIIVCTCLFLIGCGFISAFSFFAWLGYTAVLIALLFSTAALHAGNSVKIGRLKFVTRLVAQGVPIAMLLFLVLPQLPPLWQMPSAKATKTGLAETVTPGDIASLARSSELAFSATFERASDLPSPQQRYWRAMTMEQFDGKTWSISNQRKQVEKQLAYANKASPLEVLQYALPVTAIPYQLIVEPTQQDWVFSLEVSVPNNTLNNTNVRSLFDFTLRANSPVASKKAFYLDYLPNEKITNAAGDFERQLNLTIPAQGNEKTREWARNIAAGNDSPSEIIATIMQFFASEGFRYTLSPNPMPSNPIDAFLFNEKAGFCAHYAGAMVFALRAAGVPARMITGYHGGTALSDSVLQIRQYDAHAWVEVLVDERWLRFDPTSVVAPSRLTFGLEDALAEFGEERDSSLLGDISETRLFSQIQNYLEQLDYNWSKWVLGFDNKKQTDMLEELLGTLTPQKMTFVLLGVVGLISAMLAFYFIPPWQKNAMPLYRQRLLSSLALVEAFTGQPRLTMTPRQYIKKVRPLINPVAYKELEFMNTIFETAAYTSDKQDININKAMAHHHKQMRKALKAKY